MTNRTNLRLQLMKQQTEEQAQREASLSKTLSPMTMQMRNMPTSNNVNMPSLGATAVGTNDVPSHVLKVSGKVVAVVYM